MGTPQFEISVVRVMHIVLIAEAARQQRKS